MFIRSLSDQSIVPGRLCVPNLIAYVYCSRRRLFGPYI